MNETVQLLDSADLNRTVARIAHQIIEKTAIDADASRRVVLLGIPTRGKYLADRLTQKIAEFCGVEPDVGSLDITLYRDDLRHRAPRPIAATQMPAAGIDDSLVVLVDDVLFSGRTVRAALDALRDIGRPKIIQLAVLVDRGHRELPIRPDYVGKNIPTSRAEDVSVELQETDGADAVVLSREVPGGTDQ